MFDLLGDLQAAGAPGPTVEITYHSLGYDVLASTAEGEAARIARAAAAALRGRRDGEPLAVLHDLSGVYRPGTATLIIGNPGAGTTTLLQLLGGRAQPTAGRVLWNGAPPADGACGHPARVAAVAAQRDELEALLTVRETLQFAADSCLAPLPADAPPVARALRERLVDGVIDTLGLRECEHTAVGDDNMVRGISGGQKRRVTLGEALVTGARVLLLDHATHGLDTATAVRLCNFLRAWARATGGTVVAALQAPPPECVAAFDEVQLLSEGRELYHGPPARLRPYLAAAGLPAPPWADDADFALAVCASPAFAAAEYCRGGAGCAGAAVPSREQLAAAWAAEHARAPAEAAPPPPTADVPAQYRSRLAHGAGRAAALLFARQARLTLRNPVLFAGRILEAVVLGLILGSIYWKLDSAPGAAFMPFYSVLASAATGVSFVGFAAIPSVFASKRVLSRQLAGGYYDPLPFVTAFVTTTLPATLLGSVVYTSILYWMAGLAPEASRFFFAVLVLFAHELALSALFRFFSLALWREELAQAAAGVLTGLSLNFNGYYVNLATMPNYMVWVSHVSPFSWTVRSLLLNEFGAPAWAGPVDPAAPPGASPSRGQAYLDAFAISQGLAWQWAGVVVLVGYFLLFTALSALVVAKKSHAEAPGTRRLAEAVFLAAAANARSAASGGGAAALPPHSVAVLMQPGGGGASASGGPPTPAAPLPFVPAALTWSGVGYTVAVRDGQRALLRDVTGYARPGTLTALMGASGAGKTTLLDVLAQRKTTGKVTGEIRVNGEPVNTATFSRLAGFAQQVDLHAEEQTVREAVAFSAALRLPAVVTAAQRAAHVAEVLTLLELAPLAARRTGGLAPGEAKRLTIALELAANPAILFLDEPTTGLDARQAAQVVAVLRRVADTGRTVVATIHQPSADVFFSFDALLALMSGGVTAYLGPLGAQARDMTAWLIVALPDAPPLEEGVNPATWLLRIIATPVADGAAKGDAPPSAATAYAGSALERDNAAALAALASVEKVAAVGAGGAAIRAPRLGFATQLYHVTARTARYMQRRLVWTLLRVFVSLFLSLFFGLLFLQQPIDTQAGIYAKLSASLTGLVFAGIVAAFTGIPNYAHLRNVMYRERAAGLYPAAAHALALAATELPCAALCGVAFTLPWYFLVGYQPAAGAFVISLLSVIFAPAWFAWVSQWASAVAPDALLATGIVGLLTQLMLALSGVAVLFNEVPGWWQWLLLVNGFAEGTRMQFLGSAAGQDPNGLVAAFVNGVPAMVPRWEVVEGLLGVGTAAVWPSFGALLGTMALALLLSTASYTFINHQRK